MISIREAEELIACNIPQPKTVSLDTHNSPGFVLAEDLFAPCASPAFTSSAMDGFAVKWDDVGASGHRPKEFAVIAQNDESKWDDVKGSTKQNPIRLKIIGESQAGIPFRKDLKKGEAVRISTGGKIPSGSDTVIPIEDCYDKNTLIEIFNVYKQNQAIRSEGEELKKGSLLLEKGNLIGGRQLALLVSMGITTINVFARPSISLIVSGTELVDYWERRKDSQICDTNSPMLSRLIIESGGDLRSVTRVTDSLEDTIDSIRKATEIADLLVISGGVSVGPHDFVKKAAEICGFKRIFWRVDQKPGKPFFFGSMKNKLLFGLPGNPVSAYMGFFHYIRPAIARMCGKSGKRKHSKMILGNDYSVEGTRKE